VPRPSTRNAENSPAGTFTNCRGMNH
jgi:hypothetical protein